MNIDELVKKDSSFNSSIFITKATNIIKKIYNSITLNELDNVKHFMNEELYNLYKNEVDSSIQSGKRLIYDEVNVVGEINNINENNGFYEIEVNTTIKYLKYYLSTSNGNLISGDMNNRITTNNIYVFKKKINTNNTNSHQCLGCGANINVAESGICPYCGTVYKLDEFDYILDRII